MEGFVLEKEGDMAMKIATFRFGVIGDFVTGTKFGYGEKERLLAEKVVRAYEIPGSTHTRISRASILAWIAAYRKGGNRIEALCPKTRGDRGSFRSLGTPIRMEIRRLKLENHHYTVPVLIKKLRLTNVIAPDQMVNKATIYRFIRKECQLPAGDEGVDRRRFEAENSNDIWQCDVLHGPLVQVDGSLTLKKAYLMAIIDDHSRLIVHAQFYLSETFETLKLSLREAISRRGIPGKFYVDNGSCYRAEDLERILSCLGISLSHSRPYKPQGRGKVERWFKNIRMSFFPLLPAGILTLDQLNERLNEYVAEYNNAEHSSIGCSPYNRYRKDLACIRQAPDRLNDYFRHMEYRRVKKDRTVRLNGRIFEVSAKLVDRTVELHYHQDQPDIIEVKMEGYSYGQALPVNLNINARIGRDWSAEKISEDQDLPLPSAALKPEGGQLFREPMNGVTP